MLSALRPKKRGYRPIGAISGLARQPAPDTGAQIGNEGFTLLEVIVALAILSISLTLVLRTLSGGFHYQQQARTLADATQLAQSLLARVGVDLPLRPGIQNGTVPSGLLWQIQITPYGSSAEQRDWPAAAYAVSVEISSPQAIQKPITALNTLRLGPRDVPR
jgi:general secretion pathway protein I